MFLTPALLAALTAPMALAVPTPQWGGPGGPPGGQSHSHGRISGLPSEIPSGAITMMPSGMPTGLPPFHSHDLSKKTGTQHGGHGGPSEDVGDEGTHNGMPSATASALPSVLPSSRSHELSQRNVPQWGSSGGPYGDFGATGPSESHSGMPSGIAAMMPSGIPPFQNHDLFEKLAKHGTGGVPSGFGTGRPSGMPTGIPTGKPTGMPSWTPTGMPSGLPSALHSSRSHELSQRDTQQWGGPGGSGEGRPSGSPFKTFSNIPSGLHSGMPSGLSSGVAHFRDHAVSQTATATETSTLTSESQLSEQTGIELKQTENVQTAIPQDANTPTTLATAPSSTVVSSSSNETSTSSSAGLPSDGLTKGSNIDPNSQTFADICIYHHNIHRRDHLNTPDVTWDSDLASKAQQKSATCVYDESQNFGGPSYGMNIAGGSPGGSAPNPSQMISNGWYLGEIDNYPQPYGQANPPDGDFEKWGHYSQVVWPGTNKIGCGIKDCGGTWFGVCLYDSPGNMAGQYNTIAQPEGTEKTCGNDGC